MALVCRSSFPGGEVGPRTRVTHPVSVQSRTRAQQLLTQRSRQALDNLASVVAIALLLELQPPAGEPADVDFGLPEFFELIRQPQFGHREDFRFQTCANRLAIGFAARVI